MLSEWKKIEEKSSQKAKKHEIKYKNVLSNFKDLSSLKNLIKKITSDYLKNPKANSNKEIV